MPDGDLTTAPTTAPTTKADECVQFVRTVADAETTNRNGMVEDLKFSYGKNQWRAEDWQARDLQDRPALVINETDAYCRQITNAMKQQRPRIKVHPVDSGADVKTAKVITGLCRHVEVNSNADIAYDLAGDMAVRAGVGYWRLRHDYVRENSFDQDIFIDPQYNPFAVYFDPNSVLLDGSDAKKAAICEDTPIESFKREFPGARFVGEGFQARATGDTSATWVNEDHIRLAEYFQVDLVPATLVRLAAPGQPPIDLYEDQVPPQAMQQQLGLTVIGTRKSYRRIVRWQKQTAFEVLDSKVMPGRWIPIVPCYGVRVWIDGKMEKFGAVRFARDPQIMINFWNTSITECVAQAPKAKWLMAVGQGDGFENQFAKANVTANAILYYNQVDTDGRPAPPPSYIQPQGAPEGMMVALAAANQNLQRVMGQMNSDVPRPGMFPKSKGLADRERSQSEQSNYHFYDNLTTSICHTGKIILDWAPTTWDVQSVRRIIGEDGKPDLVTINERKNVDGVETVLNDMTVGTYDVVMQTGPGYDTKREEGLDTFMAVLQSPLGEKVAQVADDVVVRMMDVHGAEEIADRLAAANPLSQIDENSDVPPQAQMMIKGLQAKLEEAMKALQAAELEKKYRTDVEAMRQDGETKRVHLKEAGAVEREVLKGQGTLAVENAENEAWMRDVAVKAQTSLSVAEINAFVKLLTTKSQIDASDRGAERQISAAADQGRREAEPE